MIEPESKSDGKKVDLWGSCTRPKTGSKNNTRVTPMKAVIFFLTFKNIITGGAFIGGCGI